MGISRRIFDTSVSKSVAEINDKLVEFGADTTGTPSGDVGIIANRGSSDNVFIGWDESTDKVTFATTSATGASTGDLTLTATAIAAGDIQSEGSVSLKEKSNAIADTAAYGQVWVKTATPNELYFTTDAGDDIQITSGTALAGGGGGVISGDLTVTGGGVSLGNTSNGTMSMSATAHDAAGKNMTLSAGPPTAGTTNNIAGGTLTLEAGQGKGSGAGGDIVFKTANASSSGSSLNSLATALTISDDLSATFAGTVNCANIGAGTDNSVVVLDSSGNLKTDEIDSRVWGTTLVDGSSGADNHIAVFTDSNTVEGAADFQWDAATSTMLIKAAGDNHTAQMKWEQDNATDGWTGFADRDDGSMVWARYGTNANNRIRFNMLGNLEILTDGAGLAFGADGDITLTHAHNAGLILEQATDTTGEPILSLKVTGDVASGPGIHFASDNGAGEADGDVLGFIKFFGDDSSNSSTEYVRLEAKSADVTNNDEGGLFRILVMSNLGGSETHNTKNAFQIKGGLAADAEVVINEDSGDMNFRVESDSATHMLFVDGANNGVSVGSSTDAPAGTFEVATADGAAAVSMTVTHLEDTNNAVNIAADALTTADVINITADALTSGSAINIDSNCASTTARQLVKIHNNHASAINAVPLQLTQDAPDTNDGHKLCTLNAGAVGSQGNICIKEAALTLSTGGATTDISNFLPSGCIPLGLGVRVTTNITGSGTTYVQQIGTVVSGSADTDSFAGSLTDAILKDAGETSVFTFNPAAGHYRGGAASDLRVTCNGTPTGGAIRVALHYYKLTAPTS